VTTGFRRHIRTCMWPEITVRRCEAKESTSG